MNEETNPLPKLPTGEELEAQEAQKSNFLKDDGWWDVDVSNDLLDFAEPYRPPRYTMERGGIPFADVGELHIISGKPGNGKTGLISQMMATVLCGSFGKTRRLEVPHRQKDAATGRVAEVMMPTVVLYIDTEQGKDDTIAIKNRVCTLAGIDYTKPCEQFKILRLRDTEEAKDRWAKILKAIYIVKPTDIFLDGMLDIVKDYNDQVECQPIIRKCMMTATEYDASLWAVLHENPLVDKLVGTLGSIVQRKVAEIFTVIKIKQSDLKEHERRADLPDIYFRVKQVKARGRDVQDWLFKYVTNAGGWGQPVEIEEGGARVIDSREMEMIKESDEIFKAYNWTSSGATYTDLERHVRASGIRSNRKISNMFNLAMESGIIYKSDKKKYHYKGMNAIAPDDQPENLPFDKPSDKQDEPF